MELNMRFLSIYLSATIWRRALYLGTVLLALQMAPGIVHAGAYDNAVVKANYVAYCGDVNGDGRLDVLIRAQPAVLPLELDDDLTVPVVLPTRSPSFVLMSGGFVYTHYTLQSAPDSAMLNAPVWHTGCHELIYGDVLGTGAGSVLIKGSSPGIPSFVVAMAADTGTLRLVQLLTVDAVGVDLSAAGTTAALKDQNGDGRTDLYISVNNRLRAVALADTTGAFHVDTQSTLIATWQAMLSALDARDAATAVSYIAGGSREKYRQAFNGLGASMDNISPTLSDFALSSITPHYAIATVSRNYNGKVSLHYVTFLLTVDTWEILEF